MIEGIKEGFAKFWVSYVPGSLMLAWNAKCVYDSFTTYGAGVLLFLYLIGFVFSIQCLLIVYKSKARAKAWRRKMQWAAEVSMLKFKPELMAVFQREHDRLGLTLEERLSEGQLLAIDDEIQAILDRAGEHCNSLVSESTPDKP